MAIKPEHKRVIHEVEVAHGDLHKYEYRTGW